MRDLYDILGVPRSASDAEIKKAYRKLAKELHPDTNPGDSSVEERFKEVSAAYHILGDVEQRKRYDSGEIGADGQQPRQQRYEYAGGQRRQGGDGAGFEGFSFGGGFDADDLFSDLFGQRRGRSRGPAKGADRTYKISVSFIDAVKGATRRISMPDGKKLDVKIPPGIEDGQQIRLKGLGHPGGPGQPAGDALVEVAVTPHDHFRREGADIHLELPISLDEAVLGAKIAVPTIDGMVNMTIPKGTNSGRTLRLRGKGVPLKGGTERGDQYVRLEIMLPEEANPELESLIEKWAREHSYDVRGKRGLAG